MIAAASILKLRCVVEEEQLTSAALEMAMAEMSATA
jgi:hypothetical protein